LISANQEKDGNMSTRFGIWNTIARNVLSGICRVRNMQPGARHL
jgi:hypothetical protein